jgi:hypothetical protein
MAPAVLTNHHGQGASAWQAFRVSNDVELGRGPVAGLTGAVGTEGGNKSFSQSSRTLFETFLLRNLIARMTTTTSSIWPMIGMKFGMS